MVAFAFKDRFGSSGPLGGGPVIRDVRWAWRGIRLRGWTAVLSVTLMAVAMAAGTLVFASADALIFNRIPYPEPDQLVGLAQGVTGKSFAEYRAQSDIFSSAAGRQPSATFLNSEAEPQQVDVEFVTPGLFETLGVLPRWGRPLVESDRSSTDPTFAVIEAELAREHFGSPASAVGQVLETSERRLTVVGVMPPGFRFPNGRVKIWRALDYERLNRMFPGMGFTARLAPGVSIESAATTLTTRLPHLVRKDKTSIELVPQTFGASIATRDTMLKVLLGAALCLLLAACANVVGLELAGAVRRAHVFSIQTALGATRGVLIRTGLLEGALLVITAFTAAAALAFFGASAITSVMPEAVALGGINPVDVDRRALLVLAGTAVVVWLAASLPIVLRASRPDVLRVLKTDDRGATSSRAGLWMRRGITVSQVALAVILLLGGLLYMRSYSALVNVDTGLDTNGVYSLSLTSPNRDYTSAAHKLLLTKLTERLRTQPGVRSTATIAGAVPPGNGFSMAAAFTLADGRETGDVGSLTAYDVEGDYFPTVGLTPIRGRLPATGDDPSMVVVTDTLARRLWNDINVIGHTFNWTNVPTTFTVIGVVPHVRTDRDDLGGPSSEAFTMFRLPTTPVAQPQPGPVPPPDAAPIVNAPSGRLPYRIGTVLVRADNNLSANAVLALARAVDPGARYRVRALAEVFALRHAEARMATAIISSFAVVAFVIAIAGVFGVMTFLVNNRTREIGIRMALGAEGADVRRMVLGSSLRLIVTGVIVGAAAAALAGRWLESQLFGVTSTDPLTYTTVIATVLATAVAATWHPASRAARVDPAITLRGE
jgi:putative ABC transport system permease protein